MNEDRFLDRLRGDAAALRHEIDDVASGRVRARIRVRLDEQPGVAQIIVGWLRPLTASLTALALAAGIGMAILDFNQLSLSDLPQYAIGGEVSSVGE